MGAGDQRRKLRVEKGEERKADNRKGIGGTWSLDKGDKGKKKEN